VVEAEPRDAKTAPRFPIEVVRFQGSLEDLVARANRGDIDLSGVSVSEITTAYRRRVEGPEPRPDLRETADFLTLLARLVALKAAAVMPEQPLTEEAEDEDPGTEAGRRLAEYRLFKAAAEALLSQPAAEGARSFLGLVSPEVIPVERMRIPPERLAAAFRAVLERLGESDPMPVAITFSVSAKVAEIRERLRRGPMAFEDLFNGVATRLEAVACFLALLELLKLGEATVEQVEPFGPITVRAGD
jgi:segregation and condensation protein A